MRYSETMQVQAMPAPALVELVNGWGTVPRARGGEREPPPIAEFVAAHSVPGALAACFTDRTLERAADRLYPVFAATDAAARARLVTALLKTSGVQPALGSRCEPEWLVPQRQHAVLAAGAVALHAQLSRHGPERLGTCASTRCADAYIDASPGAHRRFCSVTCQNRERVAAFRRRRSG
jgi:predicted RNA-binding Zn ribbon-like protein